MPQPVPLSPPTSHSVRAILGFLCVLAGWFFAPVSSAMAESKSPMNVVVLYADDWRHDTLGVAGNPIVQTPTLDAMAGEGMRFTRNCVTTSICGVSRATLFTGQWMSTHGCDGFKPFKTPWQDTYPGVLRDRGYHVGHVGKWHNGKFPADKFDFGRSYYGTHWMKMPDGSRVHVTQRNENDAMEFLDSRPRDKPFCLTVAFFATHADDNNPLQFLPQPESMTLYNDVTIPVPVNATDESFRRLPEFVANENNEGRNRYHWRFDTPDKYQIMMKNYYRLATEVDSTCGRVLKTLEEQGVLDNTLVIFTTDNGYYHAEHGLADKWYPHEESIRVPLIIRDPRMPAEQRGETNDDFTLSVDLAPTILSAVGADVPESMQGRDIAPLYMSDENVDWREEFFYEHPTIRNKNFIPRSEALVQKDWKYMYWPDFDREQLFDLASDPHEEADLIDAPEQADRLVAMRTRFIELKKEAGSTESMPAAKPKPDDSAELGDTRQWFLDRGYTALFNGKNLDGWRNPYDRGDAKVVGDEIHLTADRKFFLVTEKSYSDFRVSVDIHLPEGKANSGVMFRANVQPNKVFGYQAECDGSDRCWSAGLFDEGRRGWIWPSKKGRSKDEFLKYEAESQAHFQQPEIRGALKRNGWNRYEIECRGSHLTIFLNGIKVTELDDDTDASGPIGIQHHGEKGQTYRFRNLFIKELP